MDIVVERPEGVPSVLLAEDDTDSREILQFLLERSGLQVTTAKDGKECLDLARDAWQKDKPFELLVVDIQLPVMKGTEAASILRQEGYDLPILAISAQNNNQENESYANAGFNGFVNKLDGKDSLISAVKKNITKTETSHKETSLKLPVLPILPHILRENPEQKDRVIAFLDKLERTSEDLDQAVTSQNKIGVNEIIISLGTASIFGYSLLSHTVSDLQKAVSNNDWLLANTISRKAQRVISGMLAAKEKIQAM